MNNSKQVFFTSTHVFFFYLIGISRFSPREYDNTIQNIHQLIGMEIDIIDRNIELLVFLLDVQNIIENIFTNSNNSHPLRNFNSINRGMISNGPLIFHSDYIKINKYFIIQHTPMKLWNEIGYWTKKNGLKLPKLKTVKPFLNANKTELLTVITILEQPYVMKHTDRNGNHFLIGFCIDLLKLVAAKCKFQYKIILVPDGKYGVIDLESGEWNGIVKQLINQKADIAVGSMTINYARESVIDFTKPFMNLGISILFKIPSVETTKLFSFMNPLAMDVWLYIMAAYVIVSLTLYVVAHFSPAENARFNITNSFWFAIGTLMQQGNDLNPIANSTRIVSGVWWFFTLIVIASYTANLAAFLTVERMITPIENAEDLASQQDIQYGTLDGGSTMTFFRDSKIDIYQKMWRSMENRKQVFTATYEEGVQRVLAGNYAFLMESTMLDYVIQRNCNLTQIGGLLDNKGYGLATPKGSEWRNKISLAILELQETGEIQMLYDKWWKPSIEGNISSMCVKTQKKHTKANSLDIHHIGGIFVVLLCGLSVAIGCAIGEFFFVINCSSSSIND